MLVDFGLGDAFFWGGGMVERMGMGEGEEESRMRMGQSYQSAAPP